jgi:ABC-2 type transport system ATP-binding protein
MIGIEAKGLRVEKAGKLVLRDITFSIMPGEIVGLVGPSGAGKTTLMRAIVGVQTYQGSLRVLGEFAGSARLRTKIGYVTQSPSVYDDLTVRQNLAYFATLLRASQRKIDEIIATVQLAKKAKQIVASLSGGQRARVSLAIALLGDPELLVLDEPTVGLDPLLRRELWGLFAELAARGKTLLISSHVMDEAEKCSQLLLVRDGSLLWSQSRQGLLRKTNTKTIEDAFLAMVEGGGE